MVHGPSNSYIAFGSCKGLVSLKLRPALWIRPFKGLASLKLIYAIWMGLESLKLIHSIVMRPLTAWSTFMNSYLDGLEPYSWIIVLLGWWDFRGSATGDSQNQPIRSNHRTPALHDHDLFFHISCCCHQPRQLHISHISCCCHQPHHYPHRPGQCLTDQSNLSPAGQCLS